jgi:hypothetical protein
MAGAGPELIRVPDIVPDAEAAPSVDPAGSNISTAIPITSAINAPFEATPQATMVSAGVAGLYLDHSPTGFGILHSDMSGWPRSSSAESIAFGPRSPKDSEGLLRRSIPGSSGTSRPTPGASEPLSSAGTNRFEVAPGRLDCSHRFPCVGHTVTERFRRLAASLAL